MVVGIQKHLTVTLFFIAQVKEAVVENMGRSLEGSRERKGQIERCLGEI